MSISIAINGYGRIGRNVLRALYERGLQRQLRIVAINDLASLDTVAHLTRHDSTHGRFQATVEAAGDSLVVNGDAIRVFNERDPEQLPWGELGVDVVHEATGLFANRTGAEAHLRAGAGKVLISAPAGSEVDATVVYGVNHDVLRAGHRVISNASCTTNCLAPIAMVLHRAIGIRQGVMTTIHAVTNDQVVTDVAHADLRRARSSLLSMIPTRTGAAAAVGLVLPELAGCLDGYAVRVPVVNVSLVDFSFLAERDTSRGEIDALMRKHAEGDLQGVLAVSDQPLVSVDFNHHPASAIYDAGLTRLQGDRLVKVVAWYDNEWGFSQRMLDTTLAMMRAPD